MAEALGSKYPEAFAALYEAVANHQYRLPCGEVDPYGTFAERKDLAENGCPVCPVLDLCAAAGAGEKFGVWGGQDLERPRLDSKRPFPRPSKAPGSNEPAQGPTRLPPRASNSSESRRGSDAA